MDREILELKLEKLLNVSNPIKARELSDILTDEFGLHIDRSDVNSALYAMQRKKLVRKNAMHQWSLMNDLPPEDIDVEKLIEHNITFTPEQESIININPSNHLLVRGQAGSGKTTVLAARAGRILSAMNHGSLLFLTYNTALCAYVEMAFSKSGMKGSIDVKTFHDWSKNTSEALGYNFSGWVTTKERTNQLRKLIKQVENEGGGHRLYDLSSNGELVKWWNEEIAWLFGQYITRLDEYLNIERVGRGTAIRLSADDRRYIWPVYEAYQEWLEETNQEDYDNPAGLILRTFMEQGTGLTDELRYDHLLIDEVQDFDKSWLLAAVKIPKVSLTLAGDLAQKIYKRNFSWVSVGVQVRGSRSKKLSGSHRTTKQIMEVAKYLLIDNKVTENEDYVTPVDPKKESRKVKLIIGDSPKNAYEKGYDWIASEFKGLRSTSVAVVLPFNNQLYPAKKALEKRKRTVTLAKGKKLGSVKGGIIITTYHQLKGLEFDHVVIMGLHDKQYPGRLLIDIPEDDRAEEEQLMKRVLYVALTRAKSTVSLVGSEPFCRFFNDIPSDLFIRDI